MNWKPKLPGDRYLDVKGLIRVWAFVPIALLVGWLVGGWGALVLGR